jgi:hypothetical protein
VDDALLMPRRLSCVHRHAAATAESFVTRGVATVLALALASCAGAALNRDILRHDVGRGTRAAIELTVPELLIRYGYAVREFRNTRSLLYYATAWLHREPFADEAGDGALERRTRIIVEARLGGGGTFAVRLRAENQLLGPAADAEWVAAPATDMLRNYVREISTAIAMRIDAGVRVR